MPVVSASSSICSCSEMLLAQTGYATCPRLAPGESSVEAEMLCDFRLLFSAQRVEEGTAMQTFLQHSPQEKHWDRVSHFTQGY